jgi:hypothetical protein
LKKEEAGREKEGLTDLLREKERKAERPRQKGEGVEHTDRQLHAETESH